MIYNKTQNLTLLVIEKKITFDIGLALVWSLVFFLDWIESSI